MLPIVFWGNGIHPPWNEGIRNMTFELARSIAEDKRATVTVFTDINERIDNRVKLYGYGEGVTQVLNHICIKPFIQNSKVVKDFALFNYIYNISPSDPSNLFSSFILPWSFKRHYKKPFVVIFFSFGNFNNMFVKANDKMVDKYIVINQKIKESLIQRNVPPTKIAIIEPLVDGKKFRAYQSVDRSVPTIGYLGHFKLGRGIDLLLRALYQLKKAGVNFRLLLAWSGYQRRIQSKNFHEILRLATRYGLRESLIVKEYAENVEKLYTLIDILVLPLTTEETAIEPPLTLLEGMACERIVLCTKTNLMDDIVTNGHNGFLLQENSEKELAEKLEFLINNLSALKKVGKAGRETVLMRFSSDVVRMKALTIYEDLLNMN